VTTSSCDLSVVAEASTPTSLPPWTHSASPLQCLTPSTSNPSIARQITSSVAFPLAEHLTAFVQCRPTHERPHKKKLLRRMGKTSYGLRNREGYFPSPVRRSVVSSPAGIGHFPPGRFPPLFCIPGHFHPYAAGCTYVSVVHICDQIANIQMYWFRNKKYIQHIYS